MNISNLFAKITFAKRDISHFEPQPERDWVYFLIVFLVALIAIVAGHYYFYYGLSNTVASKSQALPAVVNEKKLNAALDYLKQKESATTAIQTATPTPDPSL